MPKIPRLHCPWRQVRPSSFTLVELLLVMGIIAILAAILLAAASGILTEAKYSRARGEITAISSALENYKTDNGVYPVGNTNGTTSTMNTPYATDPTVVSTYQTASHALFTALNGGVSSLNTSAVANSTNKVYFTFKANQVGNPTGSSYVQDPWAYSYGYSTGDGTTNNIPYNGYQFYDLWSTAGSKASGTATNSWVTNWK